MRRERAGYTLVEMLVALLALGAIVAAATVTFLAQSRLARDAAARSERLAAVRMVSAVLSRELRWQSPRADVHAYAPDSMHLRVFRGLGVICAQTAGSLQVRYRGLRLPDPLKDSLLVVTAAGGERVRPLGNVTTSVLAACAVAAGEELLDLAPDSVLRPGDAFLVFETGAYVLAGRALRYRRGASGRQPLVAEVLDDDSTDLAAAWHAAGGSPDTSAYRLRIGEEAGAAGAGRVHRLRIALLNAVLPLDSLAP